MSRSNGTKKSKNKTVHIPKGYNTKPGPESYKQNFSVIYAGFCYAENFNQSEQLCELCD